MLQKQEILLFLEKNKDLFYQQFGITKIGIFGSYARDEQSENSDIDFIIEMAKGTEDIFEKRMALKQTLSNYFSKSVDICHERAIKPVFKEIIFKEAIYDSTLKSIKPRIH
jgi:predicted nucleotidyltransferase